MNNQKELILLEDLGMQYATEKSKSKRRFGLYKCFCGNEFRTNIQSVKNKLTTSCGCIGRNNKHNLANHRLYGTWKEMMARCNNKNKINYNNYGAKGIKVCEKWHSVENFINDMYPTYEEGLTIDRINTYGNYEPDNCRWSTKTIQARNTRLIQSNNISGYKGVCWHKTAKRWIAQIKVNSKRIYLGYFDNAEDGALAYDNYILTNNLEHTRNLVEIKEDLKHIFI